MLTHWQVLVPLPWYIPLTWPTLAWQLTIRSTVVFGVFGTSLEPYDENMDFSICIGACLYAAWSAYYINLIGSYWI